MKIFCDKLAKNQLEKLGNSASKIILESAKKNYGNLGETLNFSEGGLLGEEVQKLVRWFPFGFRKATKEEAKKLRAERVARKSS